MENHRSELQKIDFMTPMTLDEAKQYVNDHREELLNNLKQEIVKPLQEIKYYKFFTLRESNQTKINIKIIRVLGLQLLEEIKNEEDRPKHVCHAWKLLFTIPALYSGCIKSDPSSSAQSNSRYPSTPSKRSINKGTKMIKNLSYRLELIPKEVLDDDVFEMERFICQKLDSKTVIDIFDSLSECFAAAFEPRLNHIRGNSEESWFVNLISHLLIRPLLIFFEFIHGESFVSGTLRVNIDHLFEATRNHTVAADIGIFKEESHDPLGLIEVKSPYLFGDFLTNQNGRTVHDSPERQITSQVVIYMIGAGQKYAILSDLSSVTLYEMPIHETDLSKIYNQDEHTLFMRYTRIKCYLTEGERPDQTLYNMLEARTAVALLIYKNTLCANSNDSQTGGRLKNLLNMIKDNAQEGAEQMFNQSLTSDMSMINPGNLAVIREETGESDADATFQTKETGATSDLGVDILSDLKLTCTKLDVSERWFTTVRSSDNGRHLNEILKIKKSTFVDLFKPVEAEMRLLSRCQGTNLVVKC